MTPIRLADYEALARDKLEEPVWDYIAGGAEDERTLAANHEAFGAVRLRPRVLAGVSRVVLGTTVLGSAVRLPVLVAPMGCHQVADPAGERSTARAAGAAGSLLVVSTMSSQPIETVARSARDVGGAAPWLQIYVFRDREITRELIRRAERAGYAALVLTADAPCLGRRERDIRNRFTFPPGVRFANFEEDAIALPGDVAGGGSAVAAHAATTFDDGLTWKDVDWLCSQSTLPIVVKGVLTAEDAGLAADHGASAVLVSNHGGRQLDSTVATLEALPEIARHVGERVEVYLDGGVRRGTDVLKALALGARAVLVGRPILWGLAVGGEAGVGHVLDILRIELEVAMRLAGLSTLSEIDPALVVGGAAGQRRPVF